MEGKDNRYVVTLSFYMEAKDDKAVIEQAHKFATELNKKDDCRATVDAIVESVFGRIGNRKVI